MCVFFEHTHICFHEVPVALLFYAYGVIDLADICLRVQRTAKWASLELLCQLLYPTQQHTSALRTQKEALDVLTRCNQVVL